MKNTLIALAAGASLLVAATAFAHGPGGWGGGWGGHMRGGPGYYHMNGEYGQGYGGGYGYGPRGRYYNDQRGYGHYPGYCWAPDAERAPYPNTAPPAPKNETDPGR